MRLFKKIVVACLMIGTSICYASDKFTPEKVMAERDIQRIFMTNGSDVSMFLTEWQTMTKEDKQEFIADILNH